MAQHEDKPGLTVGVVGTGRSAMEIIAGLSGHLGPVRNSDPSQDPVRLAPTLVGPHGRAWHVDQEKLWALNPGGQRDAQIGNWVIEAPWAHPVWHSYWLTMVHLRPFRGQKGGTMIYLEGATHELWLYALSPEHPRSLFIEAQDAPRFMTPKNFAAQLILPGGDAEARETLRRTAHAVVDGALNPDTDAIASWSARFGDNMLKDRPGGTTMRKEPGPN